MKPYRKIRWVIKNTAVLMGLLLLLSCSKHQLTDEQYVEQAKNHQAQNQLRAAIIELKNALQVNPKNVTARELLGRIYVDVGDGQSGEKELARAIDLGANSDSITPYLAKAQLMQGKFKDVIKNYKDKPNGELLLAVAEAYIALGDAKSANEYLNKAKSSQADSISVQLTTAKLAFLQNDYDKTDAVLQKILAADPKNKLAWRYIGALAIQQKRFKDAENAFQKVVDLEADDLISTVGIQAWLGLIQAQLAQKEMEKAEQNVKQLQSKSPSNPGVGYLAALLAFEKGEFDVARSQLQKINSQMPDYLPAVLLLGASQYALGNYEQADVYLSRFVEEVPGHVHARKLLAATRLKQQRSQEAIKLLEDAEDSAPEDAQLITMIAQASVAGGDLSKGTKYLKKAISANPDDPAIRAELAKVFMGQGAFDQAINELEAIADKYAKPRDVLLVSAYLRKKDYAQARKLATQLAEKNPGADTQSVLGGVELVSGARAEARKNFEKALQMDNNYLPALLNLARIDLEDGNFKEAGVRFETALLIQPNNLPAMFGLAQIEDKQGNQKQALAYIEKAREANKKAALPRLILGRYYLKTGKMNKALEVVEEFNKQHLDQPAVILLTGKVYQANGDYEKSLALFEKLVEKLPKEPGAYVELANAQVHTNQLKNAKKSLRKALAIDKDFYQAKYVLAQLEFRSGNTKQALALANELQKLNEKIVFGFSLAGDIYMQQKDYAKAREQYSKAIEREKSSTLTIKLASSYSKAKQYDKAIGVLNDWVVEHPNDYNMQMVIAQEYQNVGQLTKAKQLMEKIYAQQPENAVVLNNLAWVSYLQNDPKALEYAEKAHKLRPEEGAITDTLGWLLVQKEEQLPRAVELLRDAVDKIPNVAEIKYHLSVALYKTDKRAEAKSLLTEVVASNAEFSDIDKAKALLEKLN